MPAPAHDAQYVWFDEAGRGRNLFAAFRYAFDVRGRAAEGTLSSSRTRPTISTSTACSSTPARCASTRGSRCMTSTT